MTVDPTQTEEQQIREARRRDELAAIAQGDTAVLERMLLRMEVQDMIRGELLGIVRDLAEMEPNDFTPAALIERARRVLGALS
jgi:hypothetical protein